MNQKLNPRPWVLAFFIMLTGMFRLVMASETITMFSNFTPLGAIALFGGCYYQDKWKAYLAPLLTIWLTDIILNRLYYFHKWVFFYDGFLWVYASFAIMVLIGHCIKNISVSSVVLSAVSAALVHWLVSDFGVWIGGGIDITTGKRFTQDAHGLYKCYLLAIPYLKNMVAGNLLFGAALFGGFEFLQKRFPALQMNMLLEN